MKEIILGGPYHCKVCKSWHAFGQCEGKNEKRKLKDIIPLSINMETNFPWPMDKPIEEIEQDLRIIDNEPQYEPGEDIKYIQYLITRLKKAESERDSYRELYREADSKWNKE